MSLSFICLHGALGTAAQLDALKSVPDCPDLITFHLPGHGGVPCDGAFSNSLFADAVLEKMASAAIGKADLFGYSMGGYIALWMAWKFPEKVRSVTTLNTKLDWTPETASRMVGMFDTQKIIAKAPQMAEGLALAHAPGDWITVAEKTARFLQVLGNGHGIPEAGFRAITCPVRIFRGDADPVVSETESRMVAELIPDGSYAEIPESRHALEQVNLKALAHIL